MLRSTLVAAALLAATVGAQAASVAGVPRIVDGDTLAVSGVTVRLDGLDAEEMSEPHGRAARAALQAAVGVGASVSCSLTGAMTHGRYVARCFNFRGQDVASLVVRSGLALDCARYSGGRYRSLEPAGVRARLMQKPYC